MPQSNRKAARARMAELKQQITDTAALLAQLKEERRNLAASLKAEAAQEDAGAEPKAKAGQGKKGKGQGQGQGQGQGKKASGRGGQGKKRQKPAAEPSDDFDDDQE